MRTAPTGSYELVRAYDAFARRDCITATQLAMRAAYRRTNPTEIRCDAYMLLTLAALEMETPESALSYAVGANLLASRIRDGELEEQAEAMLDLVLAKYPHLVTPIHVDNEH